MIILFELMPEEAMKLEEVTVLLISRA